MNFETIVFWVPQTTQVNMEGCWANILKMTPTGGSRCRGRARPVRSPNGPAKQLTRCRIKHELTVGPLKEYTLFHCGSVLQRISGLLNIKYYVLLCSAIRDRYELFDGKF